MTMCDSFIVMLIVSTTAAQPLAAAMVLVTV